MIPGPVAVRMVLVYRSAVTCSTPGIARAARKPSHAAASNGSRQASRRVSHVPGAPVVSRAPRLPGPARRARARSSDGVRPEDSSTLALNCRTLEKPLANATSVIGMAVSASSRRAVCSRAVRARASGPVPSSATSSRCRCRWVTASRAARPLTPRAST